MKKVLLFLISVSVLPLTINAQCTIDPSITQSGVFPPAGTRADTVINGTDSSLIFVLPYAEVGKAYNTALQFRIPADTTIPGFGTFPLNSVEVINLLNIPPGYSYGCNPATCFFPKQTNGCLSLSGTGTIPDSVQLRLAVEYDVNVGGSSTILRDTIGSFYLVVQPAPVSIDENLSLIKPSLFPNPVDSRAKLTFTPNNSKLNLRVYNIIGNTVYQQAISADKGVSNTVEFDTSDWVSGVYIYSLESDNTSFSGRFVVNH